MNTELWLCLNVSVLLVLKNINIPLDVGLHQARELPSNVYGL